MNLRAATAGLLLLLSAGGAAAMEPPPPNPLADPAAAAASPVAEAPQGRADLTPPPRDTGQGEPQAGPAATTPPASDLAFPPLADGVAAPPPNPLRREAAAGRRAAETAGADEQRAPDAAPPQVAAAGPAAPPPRPDRIPPRSAPALGRGLMLLGIFGSEDAPRAILRLPSGAVHRVSAGQTVGGLTVTRIGDGAVSVRAGSAASTLQMP